MSWTAERARVAALSRSRTDDDPDLIAARHNLRVARQQLEVDRLCQSVGALSPRERGKIALHVLTEVAP